MFSEVFAFYGFSENINAITTILNSKLTYTIAIKKHSAIYYADENWNYMN